MAKYNLVTKVRKANPYHKMAKATHEHRSCPNLLNREFNQEEPGKVLLTDITYLYFGKGQKAYLSCVATKEIVAYHLSTSLEMDIVYKTLKKLKQAVGDHFIQKPYCTLTKVSIYPSPIPKQSKRTWLNTIDVPKGKMLG